MKLRDFRQYLRVQAPGDHPERYLHEMKRLEWIFIAVRWLGVPIVFLMAWLYHPPHATIMLVLGGVLGLCNAAACFLNLNIRTPGAQRALGIAMLAVDTLVAWGIIFLFVHEFYTAAYAGFVFLIIEAAIRFGLVGSLSMTLVFELGLYAAFAYREAAFGVRFSTSGYVFWTALMVLVAISVGIVVNEWKKQRWQSEHYLQENTLLSERHRIARELHDTVLKTLHGLALESRVLGNKAAEMSPFIGETARYIEEVCSRTSQEIREVVFNLRDDSAAEGIVSLVAKMLSEWSQATGISSEFTLTGQDIIFPPESTHHLRSVVSEALTNVQRHASASHVSVVIKTSPDALDIEISDNGCGLSRGVDELYAYVAEGKLGIAGMKERVELLGGRFLLKSDRRGTRVCFNIPLLNSNGSANEPDKDSHS